VISTASVAYALDQTAQTRLKALISEFNSIKGVKRSRYQVRIPSNPGHPLSLSAGTSETWLARTAEAGPFQIVLELPFPENHVQICI
jgi:hypothetical protein